MSIENELKKISKTEMPISILFACISGQTGYIDITDEQYDLIREVLEGNKTGLSKDQIVTSLRQFDAQIEAIRADIKACNFRSDSIQNQIKDILKNEGLNL